MIWRLGVCACLSVLTLHGSSDDVPPSSPHWLRHFTSLIGQEMDVLEKTVSPEVGSQLTEKLQPQATFRDVVKLLRTLAPEGQAETVD